MFFFLTEIIYQLVQDFATILSILEKFRTPQKDAENTLETIRNYGVNITSWKHADISFLGLLVNLKILKHHENSRVMTCVYI